MKAVFAVARMETLRLLRSRASLTLLLVVPAIQIMLFGYAIHPTPGQIAVAIAGADPSGRVAAAVAREPGLVLTGAGLPAGGAAAAVRHGRAAVGLELGEDGTIQAVIDASNPALITGVDAQLWAAYWQMVARHAGVAPLQPALSVEHLFNPDGRADWGFLPGLVGVIMMIAMTMLGALSLARERESGTWETMLTLPVGPLGVLAGKIAPHVAVGTLQGVVVLGIAAALFGLPVAGSVAALIALMPLFAAAHLVLGYAVAARATTQLEALQGAIGLYLPAMLLSGFFYPSEALPGWAKAAGQVFPLAHFIRAARAATLRGAGAKAVLAEGGPMLAFFAVMLVVVWVQALRPRARRSGWKAATTFCSAIRLSKSAARLIGLDQQLSRGRPRGRRVL
jgi:ABC-2 type transport system permease protein